ncbi:histidine--tRNA ligase [Candidatus Dojkabacteria bacterium]|jgi:histidyl-tRNA synthetase|nr:histidine--tRNA ligase [Candidatus Dojkabacteria bacterium]
MEKTKLTTQPYKGTRDFYPLDVKKRDYLFNIWRQTALEFGYEEYDTPILEEAALYRAKSGDELANTQLYNFTDKGGREVAIRPEMTPSLARMIAAKVSEIPKPIRWFNIGKYYRYEKPQKGRSREFFQLNIDLLGIETIDAEVEVFAFINSVMEKLKAPKNTWCIFLNNRYLMDYVLDKELKLDDKLKKSVARAIDNYTKVKKEEFPAYLKETGLNDEQVTKLVAYLQIDFKGLEKYTEKTQGAKDILEVLNKTKALGITNVEFKPYIMRGLAYYTGCVIELYDVGGDSASRALFGGGRYDDLLTIFGKDKLPAFGIGWGDVTTEDYLETYNLYPIFENETEVFVTLLDKDLLEMASLAAQYLRNKGVKVEQQLKEMKLGKQLEYANKKGFKFALIVEENGYQIKNLKTREQKEIKLEDIPDLVM